MLRDGQELEVDVQLARPRALVPLHLDGGNPSYLVVAGQATACQLEVLMVLVL